jgi:ribulose-phosphate 3-epimerase
MRWGEWARAGVIEPSLYAADFARLGEQVESLLDAGARVFQFDVGDGHFIGEITIGPVVLRSIAGVVHDRGGILDCHLMVSEPERHFGSICDAGGDSVTFHMEAVDDPQETAARARELGLGAGIAFNPETDVERAAAAAEGMDVALCMSIHPGLSGQKFMPESLGRIEKLRSLVPDTVLVQVDGGVSADNVAEIRSAGADLLVAGSAIFWQADPGVAYLGLLARATESGA